MEVSEINVRNHGSFAGEKVRKNAVYNAVILEKIAEMDLKTTVLNPKATIAQYVLDKHCSWKQGLYAYYRQSY